MPPTKTKGMFDEYKATVASCIAECESTGNQEFADVMRSVLVAAEYEDDHLLRSSINAALEQYQEEVDNLIVRAIAFTEKSEKIWIKARTEMTGSPCAEDIDDLGNHLVYLFRTAEEKLTEIRETRVVPLREHGHDVNNAGRLEAGIAKMAQLKEYITRSWPWTSRKLPPVNRKMVAESRAEIAQGKGINIEDAIRQLGGDPTKTE